MFPTHRDIHSSFEDCSAVLRLAYIYLIATALSVRLLSSVF